MLKDLLDFLFPRRCVVCSSSLVPLEDSLCEACASDVPYTYYWSIERNPMSEKINVLIENELAATEDDSYTSFSQACALMFYRHESRYRDIPMQIKYYRNFSLACFFCNKLGSKLCLVDRYSDVDCIIPVPLHPLRRLFRGYNQAELISRGIAQGMELPASVVRTNVIRRRKYTKSQTILSYDEKKANVFGAFALASTARAELEGCGHVLLVDDVCTTGATIFECYKVLRTAFAGKISFATLAYYDL